MARSSTLADKYARYKGNVSTRPDQNYPRRAASLPLRKSYSSTLRSSFDEAKQKPTLPGLFGSPIKSFRATPSSTTRPISIYKMLPYLPSKPSARTSVNERYTPTRVLKDRSWLHNRPHGGQSKLKLEGLLAKLRGLIPSFDFSSHNDLIKMLSSSAKEVLDIPKLDVRSTVLHDQLVAPRFNKAAYYGEFDEVDASVQLAKNRIANERRRREEIEHTEAIGKLENEICLLKEQHGREVYLMKADHEAKVSELNSRIQDLTNIVNSRRTELEREKLHEFENTVLQNNESFLVYQRETEEKLEQHSRDLEVKERELARKESELELLLRREKAKIVQDHAGSFLRGPANERIETPDKNIEQHIQRPAESMDIEREEISKAIRVNDKHILNLYDIMQKVSERIMSEPQSSQSDTKILNKLEELVLTLDQQDKPAESRYEARLRDYDAYLDTYDPLFSQNKSWAGEQYDTEKLENIGDFFNELKERIEAKVAKRKQQIHGLQQQIELASISDSVREVGEIQAAASAMKKTAKLLSQQEVAVSLLQQLAKLQGKLKNIQTTFGRY